MRDKNVDAVAKMVCFCCGKPNPDVHHWRSRGAGGSDKLTNLVPLCRKHHDEFHNAGRDTFWEKYKNRITTYRLIYGLPDLDVESETLWEVSYSTSGA